MTMRVGSLFSGIGGLDLGFERAGCKIVWQIEKDAYCRRVLKRHFDARIETDVCKCGKDLEDIDAAIGGFPCQDISEAGLRAGIHGARSVLCYEYLRIIEEKKPQIVVMENVPAIRKRGLAVILERLASSRTSRRSF